VFSSSCLGVDHAGLGDGGRAAPSPPLSASACERNGRGRRGPFLFACAGNTAQRHWSGGPSIRCRGRHRWATSQTDNVIVPWGGENHVAVELLAKKQIATSSKFRQDATQATRRQSASDAKGSAGREVARPRGFAFQIRPRRAERYAVSGARPEGLGRTLPRSCSVAISKSVRAREDPFPGDGPPCDTTAVRSTQPIAE